MSSAYGGSLIPKPIPKAPMSSILPMAKTLRNGMASSLHSIDPNNTALVDYLHQLFNLELEDGSTYPQEDPLDRQAFVAYFLSYDAFVLVKGDTVPDQANEMQDNILGTFYVKPNYPGRCSHICNAGFVTSSIHRGNGAGVAMGESLTLIATTLGYKGIVFNLVFANNTASLKIWPKLGFNQAGVIPKAARLKNSPDQLVDAIIFHKDLTEDA
ncbi:hypothetical protein DM01DRAFT_260210 [Hesseltinella vesiculosa]|uniref:N-acetyltransferase domain-containing protein n=1 Tax=Hesseltinella vesiculosa TaxID=101127 RepID=A0A1X2GCN3_9FUNG|nr:hypothetical protein DM01DRAFT_260210 [Hesseltinella vesiculosa]